MSNTIGIVLGGPGIGDKLQFSALPENYFLNTGKRLVDVECSWVFDHNPFVLRGHHFDELINMWHHQDGLNRREERGEIKRPMYGVSSRVSEGFNLSKCYLRHPRLYRFEDAPRVDRQIVVHTDGRSEGGVMPDHVIEAIAKNYSDFRIIQIGGNNDRSTPFENAKGLGLWQSAKLIAESEMFIGVNSSMMNIANCYPRVRKKIVVLQYNELQLEKYCPTKHPEFTVWIDFNCELFNQYDFDVGVTNSYKKI